MSAKPPSTDLSTTPWAQRLLARPLVEIRRGLSLDFLPAREPSSVLALTAPSGKFVDIRFDLFPAPSTSSIPRKETSFAGYATAGICTPSLYSGTAGENACPPYESVIHVRWKHVLDSSHRFNEDGADMILLGNGDVMEYGAVEIEGKMRMFREYWVGPGPEKRQSPCVVMETKKGDEMVGMVVRIGDYCQGIYQDREKCVFWLERWEKEGEWVRDARSNTGGEDAFPCEWVNEGVRRLGEMVTIGGREWEVTEVFVSKS
jgi:hypothetical protein